jgi:hypothetical protein
MAYEHPPPTSLDWNRNRAIRQHAPWPCACSLRDVPTRFRRLVGVTFVILLVSAAAVRAQTPQPLAAPHLRPNTRDERALLDELLERSITGRALAARLEQSDLIVYIRLRPLGSRIDGRIGLLSAAGGRRFFVVEVARDRPINTLLVSLAHELHHACEIADAPSIVDVPTLLAFYARVGIQMSAILGQTTYETSAAAGVGAQVRSELHASTALSTPSRY